MAYVNGTTTPDGNGTSSTIAVPSGAASGHIAVAGIYIESAATISPPDGTWTQKDDIGTSPTTQGRLVVFWKRLTAADTGNYVFTWTGSAWQQGACVLLSGRSTSGDPFESVNRLVAATDSTPDIPAVTATANADLISFVTQFNTASTWTAPTSPAMTTRTSTAGQGALASATADAVSAGSTGVATWGLGGVSGFAHGFLGSLHIAGGGGSSLTDNPSDALGLTDSAARVNDAVRTPADPLGLTDSLSATNAAVRGPADPLGMTDSLSVVWDRVATISDALGITDPGQNSDIGTNVTDALGLTDSLSVSQSGGSLVADNLGMTDSLSVTWARVATISDGLGMSDANVKSGDLSTTLADALGMTDSLSAVFESPPETVSTWIFNPPTRSVLVGTDSLWGRITQQVGRAVLKMVDGSFRTVDLYDPKLPGVETVYLGGYVHTLDAEAAELLTQAGYGDYLTEVTT